MFCKIKRVALGLVVFITAGQSLEAGMLTSELTGSVDTNIFDLVNTSGETSNSSTFDSDAFQKCSEIDSTQSIGENCYCIDSLTALNTSEDYDLVLKELLSLDSTAIYSGSGSLLVSDSVLSGIETSDSGTLLCFTSSSLDSFGRQTEIIDPVLGSGDTPHTSDSVVPEPQSMALFGLGSLGIGMIVRRRKKQQADIEVG
ncbi:MAG: PEP-CTERM sorting domain-containing protein [Planctomycetaceae bacterium]|nr:PEP-CTERM sorting domain-containing protein [Planctomycetaceae bacterium]